MDIFGLVLMVTAFFVYDVANGQMKHIVADSDNAQSQIGSDFLAMCHRRPFWKYMGKFGIYGSVPFGSPE